MNSNDRSHAEFSNLRYKKKKRKRLKRSFEESDHLANCSCNEQNHCTCLKQSTIEDELYLDDHDESTSITLDSYSVDEEVRWLDNDPINFNLIQDNWTIIPGYNRGVRDICNPVTVATGDRWFKSLESRQSTTDTDPSIALDT